MATLSLPSDVNIFLGFGKAAKTSEPRSLIPDFLP
jgi:hypothetical protein